MPNYSKSYSKNSLTVFETNAAPLEVRGRVPRHSKATLPQASVTYLATGPFRLNWHSTKSVILPFPVHFRYAPMLLI
jgi:hypothetical protein